MWSGCTPLVSNDHTETARDLVWKFSMRGGFSPVTVSLSQNTTTAVLRSRCASSTRSVSSRWSTAPAGAGAHRSEHAPVRSQPVLLIQGRPMSRASQTPVMRQYLTAKAAHRTRSSSFAWGTSTSSSSKTPWSRRGPRSHPDGSQQGVGRRDTDGGRAPPRGERVRAAIARAGVQGRICEQMAIRRRSKASSRARWWRVVTRGSPTTTRGSRRSKNHYRRRGRARPHRTVGVGRLDSRPASSWHARPSMSPRRSRSSSGSIRARSSSGPAPRS